MLGTSVSAQAADLGGDCCADLEERIAELEATTARKGNRKVSLTISGWVNEAVFFWDDGTESNVYVGTNSLEQSRFKFAGEAKIDKDWSAGYTIEVGINGNASSSAGTRSTAGAGANNVFDAPQEQLVLKSKTYGKLTVGLERHVDLPSARRRRRRQHAQLLGRRSRGCRAWARSVMRANGALGPDVERRHARLQQRDAGPGRPPQHRPLRLARVRRLRRLRLLG